MLPQNKASALNTDTVFNPTNNQVSFEINF